MRFIPGNNIAKWTTYSGAAPKAYNEDASIKRGVDAEIASAKPEAERLQKALGKNSFNMTGSAVLVTTSTENWQKALGGHNIWGSASVSYDPATNTYTMKLKITMEDFYNFNKGQADIATGLPDDENGRFEVFGWAKSFYSRGSLERTITWKGGEAGDTTNTGTHDRSRDNERGRDRDRDRRDRSR